MATHVNNEGERIAIENRVLRGNRVKCLVLYDDPPPEGTGRPAPMLLDKGTQINLEDATKVKVKQKKDKGEEEDVDIDDVDRD